MSDGHDHDADEGASAHDDHGFDGEPAKELGEGEPMTPGWVPAIGGALFVGLAIFGLVESQDGQSATTAGAPPSSANAAAEAAPKPVQALPSTMRPAPRPLAQPGADGAPPGGQAPAAVPDGAGSPPIKRLSPREIQEVQRRIQEKMKQQPGGQ